MPDDNHSEADDQQRADRAPHPKEAPGANIGLMSPGTQPDFYSGMVDDGRAGANGAPPPPPSYPMSLLGDPVLYEHGNEPVRIAVMTNAQQTYGNHAVQRFIQRRATTLPVPVQRDTTSLPAVPDVTLPSTPLVRPHSPSSRAGLLGDQHLQLDPQIEAMMRVYVQERMDIAPVQAAGASFQPTGAPGAPAGQPAPGGSGGGAAQPAQTPAAPSTTPPGPGSGPIAPGAGPDKPQQASPGQILQAALASEPFKSGWQSLQTRITSQAASDWGKLRTGERIALVSTTVAIGIGALGGITLSDDPSARQLLLSQLNGRTIPVPGVDWFRLEVNTGGDGLMFGMHADVGALLGPRFGFRASGATAIGGPPQPQPYPIPFQRAAANSGSDTTTHDEDIAGRISSRTGAGSSIDRDTRSKLESGLGADLSGVRVHTDGEADRLARSVDAIAFTTGSDIFFRQGAYNPTSTDGLRLLAHETTHTVQQSQGPVAGTPSAGGVSISDPSDPFEQAAERTADSIVSGVDPPAQRMETSQATTSSVQRKAHDDEEDEEGGKPAQRSIQRTAIGAASSRVDNLMSIMRSRDLASSARISVQRDKPDPGSTPAAPAAAPGQSGQQAQAGNSDLAKLLQRWQSDMITPLEEVTALLSASPADVKGAYPKLVALQDPCTTLFMAADDNDAEIKRLTSELKTRIIVVIEELKPYLGMQESWPVIMSDMSKTLKLAHQTGAVIPLLEMASAALQRRGKQDIKIAYSRLVDAQDPVTRLWEDFKESDPKTAGELRELKSRIIVIIEELKPYLGQMEEWDIILSDLGKTATTAASIAEQAPATPAPGGQGQQPTATAQPPAQRTVQRQAAAGQRQASTEQADSHTQPAVQRGTTPLTIMRSRDLAGGLAVQRDNPPGAAAPPTVAKEDLTATNDTFDIEADSLAGAAAVIAGMGDAADTTWNPKYSYSHVDGKLTEVSITANINVLMPNWPGASKLNSVAKAEWDRAYKALSDHEQAHVDLAKQYLTGVAARMIGKTKAAADAIFNKAVADLNKASKAFDAKTDHGRKTGTIIDTDAGKPPPKPAQPMRATLQRVALGEGARRLDRLTTVMRSRDISPTASRALQRQTPSPGAAVPAAQGAAQAQPGNHDLDVLLKRWESDIVQPIDKITALLEGSPADVKSAYPIVVGLQDPIEALMLAMDDTNVALRKSASEFKTVVIVLIEELKPYLGMQESWPIILEDTRKTIVMAKDVGAAVAPLQLASAALQRRGKQDIRIAYQRIVAAQDSVDALYHDFRESDPAMSGELRHLKARLIVLIEELKPYMGKIEDFDLILQDLAKCRTMAVNLGGQSPTAPAAQAGGQAAKQPAQRAVQRSAASSAILPTRVAHPAVPVPAQPTILQRQVVVQRGPSEDADRAARAALEEKEKKALAAAQAQVGKPAFMAYYDYPEKENPRKWVFAIAAIKERPSSYPPRLGFESVGPAIAYASVVASATGAVVIEQDKIFFAATLAPNEQDFVKDWVRYVSPVGRVQAVIGKDGYVFPANQHLLTDKDQLGQRSPDDQKTMGAGVPNAAAMRAIAGIPEGPVRPGEKPKTPDAVDIPAGQEEAFILNYMRARGVEMLEQNKKVADDLTATFKPTSPTKKEKKDGTQEETTISPEAQQLIDSARAIGPKFRSILDTEMQLALEIGSLGRSKSMSGGDWEHTIPGKGTKRLNEWISETKEQAKKVEEQKNQIILDDPMLGMIVRPQTPPSEVGQIVTKAATGVKDIIKWMPGLGAILVRGGEWVYDKVKDSDNPYDDSPLNSEQNKESDEKIRDEYLKKLDGVHKAIQETRADVVGGDADFLFGLSGLRAIVKSDLESIASTNTGLKYNLDRMLADHGTKELAKDIGAAIIQIGLLFVPGGQFLSAVFGFAMAAKDMGKHLNDWNASMASAGGKASTVLLDKRQAEEKLTDDTLALAMAALDVAISTNHALSALEEGRTPKGEKPKKPDEATEPRKKTAADVPGKTPPAAKAKAWDAADLSTQFEGRLKWLGIDPKARTIAPSEVMGHARNDWEEVKSLVMKGAQNEADTAAGEFFMMQMTAYRREVDVQFIRDAIADCNARNGTKYTFEDIVEAVGSDKPTSDLDWTVKGPHSHEIVEHFNTNFRNQYGRESGVVFDTNMYTKSAHLEYPITPDPTKPAKTIDIVPHNPAAADATGGLEAWEKFQKQTIASAKTPQEAESVKAVLKEAEAAYPHDLRARLQYVNNYNQDVASHITMYENCEARGEEGMKAWENYKKMQLDNTPGDKRAALERIFKSTEERTKVYQGEVAKRLEILTGRTWTQDEIAKLSHSSNPAERDLYTHARNSVYQDQLNDLAWLKQRYAAATTEAEKAQLAAQINAKQSETLYYASEAYQTGGSLLSVVQNTQMAKGALLDPAYGAMLASESGQAFAEQYGKFVGYVGHNDIGSASKAGKYAERAFTAELAHPLAAGKSLPEVVGTIRELEAIKNSSPEIIEAFLKKKYPGAKNLEQGLQMHFAAMGGALAEWSGQMASMRGKGLPAITMAWEEMTKGGNTERIMSLIALLARARAEAGE